MRSAALATLWELYRRHRWGALGVVGYVLFGAAFKLLVVAPGTTVRLAPPDGTVAVVFVPLSALFLYFLAAFSFGLDGDLLARASIYPSRRLTLPVSTAALAGWPMLWGALAMAGLWLVTALLARWPWGIPLPFVWPALLGVVFLAWTQALMWMPYGLRGLRMIVAVVGLMTLDAVVILAIELQASEALLAALLAPQLPLAFFTARVAVARARRGEVPDWRPALTRLGRIADLRSHRPHDFSSAAHAQAWLEWRRHGWSLPTWVTILLPFELALLWIAGSDSPTLVFWTLLAALLTPAFMAAFSAPRARMAAFLATRPLTSAALAGAKLKTALWSTLAAWLVVLVAIPPALFASGTWPVVVGWAREAVDVLGAPRAVAAVLLGFLGLLVLTWKQWVQALGIALSGRGWLVRASLVFQLSLLVAVALLHDQITTSVGMAVVWSLSPWLLAGLVGGKTSAAVWIATRLAQGGLLAERALLVAAAVWSAAVVALYAAFVWLFDTPPVVARYLLALVAILAVPVARPGALLLALASSRHQGAARSGAAVSGRQRGTIAVVAALLALPAALALTEALVFHIGQRSNGRLVSGGREREYLLFVPSSYDPKAATPLVISLHGGAGWPALQKAMSGWNQVAEREGFLVVYPAGDKTLGPRAWEAEGGAGSRRDVAFISELIDVLSASYNVDPRRIYANGLSNGGAMAFVLSCTLSDRIAAVGMVAPAYLLPFRTCTDRRAVPMITFHGTADRSVPYHGGSSWVVSKTLLLFPDARAWTAEWAQRNRCDPDPVETTVAAGVSRLEHPRCADDAAVVLYTLQGGGHSWPGGKPLVRWLIGPTSGAVDATREMWRFFREHPLAPR